MKDMDVMRIGINCICVNPNYRGGINTYILGLLDGFRQVGSRHKFQIYIPETNREMFADFAHLDNFELVVVPFHGWFSNFKRILTELTVFTRSTYLHRNFTNLLFSDITRLINRNSDILYTPIPTLFPYTLNIPQVLSMHDIQQVHYPKFFSRHELISRTVRYRISAEDAAYIQASSEFMKDDFLAEFDFLDKEQVFVITEGVAIEDFRQETDATILKNKYSLPDDFLFFPAQLWLHKNHLTVLKALLKVRDAFGRELPLVMTGARYSASEEVFSFINENEMTGQIHYLGKVPFVDIVTLYQNARCLLSASLYESSCLPVLEAAAAGCPVIVSDIKPNCEMSQRLEMNLFPTMSYDALAELLIKVWDDSELRHEQVTHNSKSIISYSWGNIANQYLAFFESKFHT